MEHRMKIEHFGLLNYHIKSYEKNKQVNRIVIKISLLFKGNPTIWIDATIHAREWVSTATATYLLNELLTSNDPEMKELALNYDWVIVPVVNVDGYVYSREVSYCI